MTTKPALQSQPEGQQRQIEPLPDPPRDPDAMRQLPYIARANLILEAYFLNQGRTDVLVNGEGYLCFSRRNLTVVPDCVVAFGVDPEAITENNGYVISEVGKPPDLVLEVASASTGKQDYEVKPGIYASMGVTEYWRFDRTGGRYHDAPLGGDRLVDGVYLPVELTTDKDGVIWGHSQVLGLEVCWDNGRLRFYDPVAREYLPDLIEANAQRDTAVIALAEAEARADSEAARAEAEAARADAEAQRANTEAQRANEAEAELRRLREQLRREAPE